MNRELNTSDVGLLVTASYSELRGLADRMLAREAPGHLLQRTALVHEAVVRLLRQSKFACTGRTHCVAVAAIMMRRILIDAGRRDAHLRCHVQQIESTTARQAEPQPQTDMLALGEALERLAAEHPRKARVVELRFFGGLSLEATADALGTTTRTIERDWQYARAWLYRTLFGDGPEPATGAKSS